MSCCSETEKRALFDKHAGPDGKLSREELKKMAEDKLCCKIVKGKCPDMMDKDLFDEFDTDKDGSLSFEEFLVVAEKMKKCKDNMGQQMKEQKCCKK